MAAIHVINILKSREEKTCVTYTHIQKPRMTCRYPAPLHPPPKKKEGIKGIKLQLVSGYLPHSFQHSIWF